MKYILVDNEVPIRTETDTILKMQETLTSRRPVYGIKCPTALLLLDKFNLVSGFVPDNMNYVNMGIAKQILSYWIDTNGLPYSLTNDEIKVIEMVLQNIKLPNQISRLCRNLQDKNGRKPENLKIGCYFIVY